MRRYALSRYKQRRYKQRRICRKSNLLFTAIYPYLKKNPDTNRDTALAYETAVYSQNFARHVVKPVGKTHNGVRHVVGSAQP